MKKKININLSNEVLDIYNGKKHSFDPEFIIPLKQELFRQAIKDDKNIIPCLGDHFNVFDDELVFWYNSTKTKTTKMNKIKIGN